MITDDEMDVRFNELEDRLRAHLAERQTMTTRTVVPLIENNHPVRHRRLAFLAVAAGLVGAVTFGVTQLGGESVTPEPAGNTLGESESADLVGGDGRPQLQGEPCYGSEDEANEVFQEKLGVSYSELERRYRGRPYEELVEFVRSTAPEYFARPVIRDERAASYGYAIYHAFDPGPVEAELMMPNTHRLNVKVDSSGLVVAIGWFG